MVDLRLASHHLQLDNVIRAWREIPDQFIVQTDVVVSNAAYGFKEQDPFSDLLQLQKVFKPLVIIVDFFSELRPYEPDDAEGYLAFHPHVMTEKLCEALGTHRFILDHSGMPHAFTLGLGFTETPWEKHENESVR